MKILFIVLACLVINAPACRKNNSNDNNQGNCITVTITNTAPGCGGWGIIVNGIKYPSRNIPLQYQQNNLVVCAFFELFEDKALCPCCGGTWADIKSMQ